MHVNNKQLMFVKLNFIIIMSYRFTPLQLEKKDVITLLNSLNDDLGSPRGNTISKSDFALLEAEVKGRIVYPWSSTYDDSRRDFNNVYPAEPMAIVYVSNYSDIRYCLRFAVQFNMMTSIRSGGHSLTCYSICDGMVIDISSLKSIHVNPSDKTAIMEAGNTFADINPALEFYGLHMPGGGCPTVSIAGFMQGGGYGMTSRIFGINSDCVLEVTVMLADGTIVIANDNQNKDLYWAIRGGTGGNFGVLLSVKYKLFSLDRLWGVRIEFDFETEEDNAALALFTIQQNYLTTNNHPNLGVQTVLCTDNSGDKRKKVYFAGVFIGNESELDTTIAPLLQISGANITLKKEGKYSEVNEWVLEGVPDVPMTVLGYSKSEYISKSLSVEDYKSILVYFKTAPNSYTVVDMEGYGGVINQYPVQKSAFIHRNVIMDFFCDVFFTPETNDQKEVQEWLASFSEFMQKFSNGHSFQNYPNRDQTDFRWAYWGEYYNQLLEIKNKYDPTTFFNYQQSIKGPLENSLNQKQIMLFEPQFPIIRENY